MSSAFAAPENPSGPQAPAALRIAWPVSRVVFQRNNDNRARIEITGSCPSNASRVEARLVPRVPGQGTPTGWYPLVPGPAQGSFRGSLLGEGGWYNLEVQAIVDKAVIPAAGVERVGVGEVFVVVGHSVAAGQDETIGGATDDRVNTVPLDKNSADYQAYLKTGDPRLLPAPGFGHYGTGVIPAPFGSGNYFWSKFGEHVARKQNVPVLVYNAAFGGTSLEHWAKSAQNIQFAHSFVKAPIRMPYINLFNTLKKYAPLTGLRAILADQGQNDWPEKNEDLVFNYYRTWVDQARADLGYPELAVVVNRQTPFLRDTQIRRVQERMIQFPHCFPGPDYDTLAKADRPDAIHLGLSGQEQAARLWAEALGPEFFKTSKPWLPGLEGASRAGGAAAPAPSASAKVPVWNCEARVVYSKAFPGFMDIQIYQENGRYYVRDLIKKSDYTDPRPRRAYYVDMANVGPSLETGYPLPERGGIYQVQCKRWREGKDQWDLKDAETAMEWVIKPGPLGVEGEAFIPPDFVIDTGDWRDQQHKVIPPFAPIRGKAAPSYRYNADQTWDDILIRGASHTASGYGPGGPQNALLTLGDPLDAMGQQGFAALTPDELKQYAARIAPLAFYLTDWEKQPGWHNTPTYWSIDLPDQKVLQNYYIYFQEMNRLVPSRKNGDYYRALKWNNSFYDEGEARPLRKQFVSQTEDPELRIGPAFRRFTHVDGVTRSMREVCRVYTIDWYLKSNIFPDRRRTALYQVYANLFDTINSKLITPADSTILGFAWFGTDNDLPYRQYLRLDNGWLGYYGRVQQAPWWIMTATYIGHLFGDGFHWWHDNGPEGADRRRHPDDYGMGPYLWEPDAGAPAKPPVVLGSQSEKGPVYPREPRYNLVYSKLAEYRLKQYENFIAMPRSPGEYSLDAGRTWVAPVGNERRDLLEKAEKTQPICFRWDDGGDLVMVFLAWPFATDPEWNVTLKIAPGQERPVKMHRQWPMLRVFSKSNPRYGL